MCWFVLVVFCLNWCLYYWKLSYHQVSYLVSSSWASYRMHSNFLKFCKSAFMGSMGQMYKKRLYILCVMTIPGSILCLGKVCLLIQPIWPLSNVSYAQQSLTAVLRVLDNPFNRPTAYSLQENNAFKTKLPPKSKYKSFCLYAMVSSHQWQTLTCNLFVKCTDTHNWAQ